MDVDIKQTLFMFQLQIKVRMLTMVREYDVVIIGAGMLDYIPQINLPKVL